MAHLYSGDNNENNKNDIYSFFSFFFPVIILCLRSTSCSRVEVPPLWLVLLRGAVFSSGAPDEYEEGGWLQTAPVPGQQGHPAVACRWRVEVEQQWGGTKQGGFSLVKVQ